MTTTRTHERPRLATHPIIPGASEQAAGSLAAAFHDDPVFTWIDPRTTSRRAHLPVWFGIVTAALSRHGASVQTQHGTAAALWLPPGAEALTEHEAGMLTAATSAFGDAAAARSAAISEAIDAAHPSTPHHYMWFLGTSPRDQGSGHGSTLLRHYLDLLDRRGEAAYLEATSPRNRALCERHGFEVTGTIRVPGSPTIWPMWREPR